MEMFKDNLLIVDKLIYKKMGIQVIDVVSNEESCDYGAGEFTLSKNRIKQRTAKLTPTKVGQFVTLWKRNSEGITEPHSDKDTFDYFFINCFFKGRIGQFIFSKQVLIDHGIVSDKTSKGKRGIRVYTPWDKPKSKQAIKTQKWQTEYFVDLDCKNAINDFKELIKI